MPAQRPSCALALHHDKLMEAAVARALVLAFRPPLNEATGARFTEEDTDRTVAYIEEGGFRGGPMYQFPYALPTAPDAALEWGWISLAIAPHPRMELPWKGVRECELFARDPERWAMVLANQDFVKVQEAERVRWFVERMRALFPVLEPDFGFLDTDVNVALHSGTAPWEHVWPGLLYGPTRVEQMGRERLLSAPAARVEELSYGGVWVQAAQNPIMVERRELRALAEYLGLKVPKREL